MALKQFTEKKGQPLWLNPGHISALGTIYSDGTETGEAPNADRLSYVLLKNGATFHLDHTVEEVAKRLGAD